MPHLIHRPELRPEERRSIRLSDHETALEPYPDNVKAWLEPFYVPKLLDNDGFPNWDGNGGGFVDIGSLYQAARDGVPIYYCPGCGRRYGGPGNCSYQHPPEPLQPLQVAKSEIVDTAA